MHLQLKSRIAAGIFGTVIIASLGVNILQAYMHNQDTKKISFLEEDNIKLPLGYINKGSRFPKWAANKSVNTIAGVNLIGYLVKDMNGKYNVVVESADRREFFCGDYLDPLDPSFENKYIPCKSMIIMKGNDAYFDGAGTTILGDNSIVVDMLEGEGYACCLTIIDSYIAWKAQNIIMGEK